MKTRIALALMLFLSGKAFAALHVSSDQTVGGFVHIESVIYDPQAKALYVSEFGTEKLAPDLKDGMGRIVKVGLDGKVIDKQFLPAKGGQPMNKPKGSWIRGNHFWVTDIDGVWEFDLKTKKGRKLAIPGAQFANDPAILGNALYVSDNRADKLFRIEPADFLDSKKAPTITTVFAGKGVVPNGLWPARDGMLLMGGFNSKAPNPIYALGVSGQIKTATPPLGNIDGLYELKDGAFLGTDWKTGSLFVWSEKDGMQQLAKGFKGPADFCVVPGAKGAMLVVVPDLVQGQLRFIQLRP